MQSFVFDLVSQAEMNKDRSLGETKRLPAPLARVMRRSDLDTILKTFPYLVCEKSDGDRRLLLAARRGAVCSAFLINRSFEIEEIDGAGADYFRLLASDEGPTLLDGELVERPALPRGVRGGSGVSDVFLAFDVVRFRGLPIHQSSMTERLRVLGEHVRRPFRDDDDLRAASGRPLLPVRPPTSPDSFRRCLSTRLSSLIPACLLSVSSLSPLCLLSLFFFFVSLRRFLGRTSPSSSS